MATGLKINNIEKKDLISLYKHLSVQSLLDLKSMFGRVDISDLIDLQNSSLYGFTCREKGLVSFCIFFVPDEQDSYAVYSYSTTKGYCKGGFEKIFNDILLKKMYAIVYSGNRNFLNLLKSVGFVYNRNVVYGIDNKNYQLLKRGYDAKRK